MLSNLRRLRSQRRKLELELETRGPDGRGLATEGQMRLKMGAVIDVDRLYDALPRRRRPARLRGMEVRFTRSGERRYALTIVRHDLPPLEFAGPGYDPLMPHDLQHMIVESELGLSRGVFGFMAAGGQAGGANQLAPGEDRRTFARRRAKAGRRDRKMLRDGERDEGALSEAATYVCWYEWLRRSHVPERRASAAAMAETARSILSSMPDDARATFTEDLFACVCARMDQLSARWASLAIGDSFSVEWTVRPAPRRR